MAEPQAATQGSEPVDDRLRKLGWRAARAITETDDWREAARWLDTLPHCQVTFETSDPNDERIIVEVEDCPPHLRRYLCDYEKEWWSGHGPVLTKLLDAWNAASYRFVQRVRDRYYDFEYRDARRFMLLGALTLDRDFTGEGLLEKPMPWEGQESLLDGRGWAWAAVTSAYGGEESIEGYLIESLRKLAGETGAPDTEVFDVAEDQLVVFVDRDRAAYQGHEHDLTGSQTEVLSRLVEAQGAWVPGWKIRGGRIDRIVAALPAPLAELIESKKARGYRLVPGLRAMTLEGH